ncbi:hypothetical protein GCM10023149_44860 [Mucilaginibacter gynuensis]|uniref:DUF4394 domain-containing protein n=1 Tax=Mucilaginibacter gynuensis TaxID=1302236 RepID=A0ABP8H9K6_9SPHI
MRTNKLLSITKYAVIGAFVLGLASCAKENKPNPDFTVGPNINFFALTEDNRLSLINAQTGPVDGQLAITGLQTGEKILSIDFRPATGQLYGLGSTSRIYIINFNTGVARAVNSTPFTPALSGTLANLDFNPVVDRIRVVTNTGQNLRINPETGEVASVDQAIAATNKIASIAYSDNKAGAVAAILYDIDAATDKLYRQEPANSGTLVAVGDLGVDAEEGGGFDVGPDGTALAAINIAGKSTLVTINGNTGKTTKIGSFSTKLADIAIPTDPVSYVIGPDNQFVIYNPNTGSTTTFAVTGLQPGENILGIDMRPLNGQIYALGSTSRLYTLNAASGAATVVNGGTVFSTPLSGTSFGFDFNPTVDMIRVVSNTGQNLRINPTTADLTSVDAALNPGIPSIVSIAYHNNYAGALNSTLYDIDSQTDMLYKQDPPNDGKLVPVGQLNIDITATGGFDIGGTSNLAYGIFTTSDGKTKFYNVNLSTGATTAGRDFPLNNIRGFTVGLGF